MMARKRGTRKSKALRDNATFYIETVFAKASTLRKQIESLKNERLYLMQQACECAKMQIPPSLQGMTLRQIMTMNNEGGNGENGGNGGNVENGGNGGNGGGGGRKGALKVRFRDSGSPSHLPPKRSKKEPTKDKSAGENQQQNQYVTQCSHIQESKTTKGNEAAKKTISNKSNSKRCTTSQKQVNTMKGNVNPRMVTRSRAGARYGIQESSASSEDISFMLRNSKKVITSTPARNQAEQHNVTQNNEKGARAMGKQNRKDVGKKRNSVKGNDTELCDVKKKRISGKTALANTEIVNEKNIHAPKQCLVILETLSRELKRVTDSGIDCRTTSSYSSYQDDNQETKCDVEMDKGPLPTYKSILRVDAERKTNHPTDNTGTLGHSIMPLESSSMHGNCVSNLISTQEGFNNGSINYSRSGEHDVAQEMTDNIKSTVSSNNVENVTPYNDSSYLGNIEKPSTGTSNLSTLTRSKVRATQVTLAESKRISREANIACITNNRTSKRRNSSETNFAESLNNRFGEDLQKSPIGIKETQFTDRVNKKMKLTKNIKILQEGEGQITKINQGKCQFSDTSVDQESVLEMARKKRISQMSSLNNDDQPNMGMSRDQENTGRPVSQNCGVMPMDQGVPNGPLFNSIKNPSIQIKREPINSPSNLNSIVSNDEGVPCDSFFTSEKMLKNEGNLNNPLLNSDRGSLVLRSNIKEEPQISSSCPASLVPKNEGVPHSSPLDSEHRPLVVVPKYNATQSRRGPLPLPRLGDVALQSAGRPELAAMAGSASEVRMPLQGSDVLQPASTKRRVTQNPAIVAALGSAMRRLWGGMRRQLRELASTLRGALQGVSDETPSSQLSSPGSNHVSSSPARDFINIQQVTGFQSNAGTSSTPVDATPIGRRRKGRSLFADRDAVINSLHSIVPVSSAREESISTKNTRDRLPSDNGNSHINGLSDIIREQLAMGNITVTPIHRPKKHKIDENSTDDAAIKPHCGVDQSLVRNVGADSPQNIALMGCDPSSELLKMNLNNDQKVPNRNDTASIHKLKQITLNCTPNFMSSKSKSVSQVCKQEGFHDSTVYDKNVNKSNTPGRFCNLETDIPSSSQPNEADLTMKGVKRKLDDVELTSNGREHENSSQINDFSVRLVPITPTRPRVETLKKKFQSH